MDNTFVSAALLLIVDAVRAPKSSEAVSRTGEENRAAKAVDSDPPTQGAPRS